jgi:hypothetical protein
MIEAEAIELSAAEADQVRKDDAAAAASAVKPPEGAPPAGSPPPPPAPEQAAEALADQPNAVAEAMRDLEAQDVEDLLEITEDLWPEREAQLAKGSIFYAPDARERKKLSKPLARVLAKWAPGFVTSYPDEFGLALVLVVITASRVKTARQLAKARAQEKEAAA